MVYKTQITPLVISLYINDLKDFMADNIIDLSDLSHDIDIELCKYINFLYFTVC